MNTLKALPWDLFTGMCVIAAVYILVRPNSAGPAMVKEFTDGMAGLISYAAGGL